MTQNNTLTHEQNMIIYLGQQCAVTISEINEALNEVETRSRTDGLVELIYGRDKQRLDEACSMMRAAEVLLNEASRAVFLSAGKDLGFGEHRINYKEAHQALRNVQKASKELKKSIDSYLEGVK